MKLWNLSLSVLMVAAISSAAPLAFAQSANDGGSTGGHHGHQHNNAQWQACHQQADEKKLERGEARKSFMQNCMKAAGGGNAAQKPAG
jgi:hypothetical protein